MFFDMTDIVKTCPDKKKMVAEPPEKKKCVSTQYHLGTIRMLHWRFETETRAICSLKHFRQTTLFNAVCPKPNNWGTCLCATCINPEIKLNLGQLHHKFFTM